MTLFCVFVEISEAHEHVNYGYTADETDVLHEVGSEMNKLLKSLSQSMDSVSVDTDTCRSTVLAHISLKHTKLMVGTESGHFHRALARR